MAEADDLEALVRRVDPDRWLSSRFIADPDRRADVIAIYAYDHELSRAERVTSNTLLAEIRLTWWREALDEIFGGVVRAHPAARALSVAVHRRCLPREQLEAMIDGRIAVLGAGEFDAAQVVAWSEAVGASTAVLASQVLDPSSPEPAAASAGRLWGLESLRWSPRGTVAASAELARTQAEARTRSRQVTAAAFPAIAHVALLAMPPRAPRRGAASDRIRLLWAVFSGRL